MCLQLKMRTRRRSDGSYTFSRTMDTVFNTSLTTALAFLCLVLSPIMPVRTFGIFAAMVVVCNYVMVLT